MTKQTSLPNESVNVPILTKDQLLKHWQGHRTLTRRTIAAFPEKELFQYTIGNMRPFSEMACELISIAGPGIIGMVTGEWNELKEQLDHGNNKARLLELWDQTTETINQYWPQIPESLFQQEMKIFNTYEGKVYSHFLYFIDNEVHHRGQGYVYLRSLGIEPPFFWER